MSRRQTIPLPNLQNLHEDRFRFHGRNRPGPRAQIFRNDSDDGPTLRIYAPIDSWGGEWGVSAREFAAVLDELGDAQRINLRINSPGGEVWEALAIMNSLRSHPATITAYVDGVAASAASFIASSADELVMGRNTELMIHDAIGLCMGNAADMRDIAGVLDRLSDDIAGVYAEKSGGSVADWRAAMVAESWYNPDEAVAAGLADRVDRPDADDPDDDPDEGKGENTAQNRFDLAGLFQHSGRADAPPPPLPTDRHDNHVHTVPGPGDPAASADMEARHARNRHRMAAARHRLTV